ncbi:TESK1 kinase, partial [Ceuthmochares aereus]|nr:TESK1 kinase [Ceuthmochares aereus]
MEWDKLPGGPGEGEGEVAGPWPGGGRLRPSSYRALRRGGSTLARIDDFFCEKGGAGFFSEVFKVRHRQWGGIMVLKMNKLTSNRGGMLREVQLMNRLSRGGILRLMGVCVHQGQLHALTEYINGGNGGELLDSPVPLSWSMGGELALDIACGLRYMGGEGVFHRDLTSKNCLVRGGASGYTAVVGDFGWGGKIPDYSGGSEKEPLAVVGSPYWMAPEVLRGEIYNEKADGGGYGIILCETIARIRGGPDYLPRTENPSSLFLLSLGGGFGLDARAFHAMVGGGCPAAFLQLAFHCWGGRGDPSCPQMEPTSRPGGVEITQCLEGILQHGGGVEAASHAEESPGGELGMQHLQADQCLGGGQSNVFSPKSPTLGGALEPSSGARTKETGGGINPFSQREDLKGGGVKLFDTPSKSVISGGVDLPPPGPLQLSSGGAPEPTIEVQCDFSGGAPTPRKCHSLPTSGGVPRHGGLALGMGSGGAADDPQAPTALLPGGGERFPSPIPGPEEGGDCSADSRELPQPLGGAHNSNFICTASSGGGAWQPEQQFPSEILGGDNNVVVSKPLAWGSRVGHGFSELSVASTGGVERTEHAAMLPGHGGGTALEQDEVLHCPGGGLSPLSFSIASVCGGAAPSPPRYQNLNCGGESFLYRDRGRQQEGGGPVLAEPSLKLPEGGA